MDHAEWPLPNRNSGISTSNQRFVLATVYNFPEFWRENFKITCNAAKGAPELGLPPTPTTPSWVVMGLLTDCRVEKF